MGWWTDRAGRMLGDGPADVCEAGLARLGTAGKPQLADVLAGIGGLLRAHRDRYATAADGDWRLIATHDHLDIAEGRALDGASGNVLAETLDDIAEQYQLSELARLPTTDEVIATLGFVLGHEPERLVAGAGAKLTIRRESR